MSLEGKDLSTVTHSLAALYVIVHKLAKDGVFKIEGLKDTPKPSPESQITINWEDDALIITIGGKDANTGE